MFREDVIAPRIATPGVAAVAAAVLITVPDAALIGVRGQGRGGMNRFGFRLAVEEMHERPLYTRRGHTGTPRSLAINIAHHSFIGAGEHS